MSWRRFMRYLVEPGSNDRIVLSRLRSVRQKLFAGVLVTSLGALLVTGVSMALYDLQSYRSIWTSDLNTQAELLGRASAPALQFDDAKLARDNLALLQVRPQIEVAALYTPRNVLFARYIRAGSDQRLPGKLPEADTTRFDSEQISVYRRIIQNGEVVGSIYLRAHYDFHQRLRNYVAILIVISASALLIALLLSSWLQANITRPILDVTSLARTVVETRDYSLRAKRTTEDEIGYMVDAFNGMLSEIEKRTEAQQMALKESETERERTLYISQHDSLTGLPNRPSFHRELSRIIHDAEIHHRKVQVLFIDVDRFKEINDSLGHYVGDLLLKAVASRLRSYVRKSDVVARLSGDEFGIICLDHREIEVLAATLVFELSQPFMLEDQYINASVSIGVTSFPEDTSQPAQLLMNADMAMYSAKNSGRANYKVYANNLETATKRRQAIKKGLHQALAEDQLIVHYQPVFSLLDNSLVGVEALIRWQHPEIPLLTPTELIAVAEDSGMIVEVGEWMLKKVCRQAKSWQEEGQFSLRVAINVSSRQLKEPAFIDLIDEILGETQLAPGCLDLEITERVLVENNAINRDQLQILKNKGIHISVDDFGTGFSSLSYLKHFPVDALKIDQLFVRGLPHDKQDVAITAAIISLARGLEISVVAEGIENDEQLAFLKSMGCTRGQGYLFSPAVAPEVIADRLRSGEWKLPAI